MIPSNLDKPIKVSTFTSYDLSAKDTIEGQILSTLQEAVLQNELVGLAEEKLNLKYDANNPLTYLQREAELQGQIGLLIYLIEVSNCSKLGLQDKASGIYEGEDAGLYNY